MNSNRVRTLVVSSFVALAMLGAAPSVSAAPSDPVPPTFGSSGLTVEQVDNIIRLFLPGHCTIMGSVGCVSPEALLG